MVALTSERNTRTRINDFRYDAVAASVKIFAGSIVMRNAAGLLTKGATATGCFGVGRAEATVDNSAGAAGAQSLTYRSGQFACANHSGDLIARADVGKVCYIVDDQTVAKTNGAGTRSPAGIVEWIEAPGTIWVRFDEAVTRSS